MSIRSLEYATSPKRNPSAWTSPWSWRNGSASIGPAGPGHRDRLAGLELVHVQDRRIVAAGRLDEAIGKARHQHARGRVVGIDVDAAALVQDQPAQVVDAVGVVGVLVGVEHGVEPVHVGVEKLLAQIRPGVDQHAG